MMANSRQYDIIVFGATGYTGKLTAEHIVEKLPTDLKWAIAGRSATKLEAVATELQAINPNRVQPGIEIANLNDQDLDALAKKTKVLISTVGPYTYYGEHAFKAAANNGTHYLDATGEVPWYNRMLKKYEKTAQTSGAILIPQIGLESAPSDISAWIVVQMIRERFSAPTAEVNTSIHEFKSAPSGGTLGTIFAIIDTYPLKELHDSHAPYALSPIPGPKTPSNTTLFTKLFGIKVVPDLGILTTSIGAGANIPIVQRSWGLLGGANNYGPNFSYGEYLKARNHLSAIGYHFLFALLGFLVVFPPSRWILRKFIIGPGEGPSKDKASKDCFEYRVIGVPDISDPKPPRAFGKIRYDGSIYKCTGVLLAEGAISILRNETKLSGGVHTPASLGQPFLDRLSESGDFKFEKKWLEF